MLYQYRFHAPGSELHAEPFDIQDQTRARADARAAFHVRDTFSLTRRTDVRAEFVAEYTSRRALERADTMPAPALTAEDADTIVAVLCADDLAAVGQ